MARPRTGSIYWTKSGWRARLTVEVDGAPVQKSFDLETTSKAAAKAKLKRLVKQQATADLEVEAKRSETFAEAAERIVGESTAVSKPNRLARLRNHVVPHIGQKPVDQITASDVREILVDIAAQGLSKDLVVAVRNDIGSVLGELWRAEMLPENVVARVKVPKARVDTRERAVLTDQELAIYLAYESPDPMHRRGVLERQTMACLSRMFGGLRAGDLRALTWEAFDTEGGFRFGWAPRKKTARPQLLEVPEMLRPILRDWWERAGRPATGCIFPTRKGQRAGEAKGRSNLAAALRRDLRRAFGIDTAERTEIARSNGRRTFTYSWSQARELTTRERELFEETNFTKPVDFHSFRRSFKQALADAGVELSTAMALSGASDVKAHQRYLNNTSKMRVLPPAALPSLSMSHAETQNDDFSNSMFSGGRSRDRTYDFNRVKVALYR